MADSPGILGSIHPLSDGRLETSPDLRREFKLEYPTINGKCSMISTSLDSARGRAVKGTDRKSVTFGGPGFEPEASQLFLPKWSKIPKTSPPEVVSEMPSMLDRRAPDDAMKHFGIDPDEGRAVPDVFAGNVPLAGVSHRSSPAIGGR